MQTAELLLTKIIEKVSCRSGDIWPCTTLIILPKNLGCRTNPLNLMQSLNQ